jgi:hypothetical protein
MPVKTVYVVLSYNDHDEKWSFYGVRDTFEEAAQLAAVGNWPSAPYALHFELRKKHPDALIDTYGAWEGHDHFFIIPCTDEQ